MRLFYLFPIVLLAGCSSPKQEKRFVLPVDAAIHSRLTISHETMNPTRGSCPSNNPFFKELGFSCSFFLNGVIYVVEYQHVLNENGRIKEFWPYIAEGPYVIDDSLNLAQSVEKDFSIRLSKDREYVIDCGDTLAITHIFENEQLLFTERSSRTTMGRRWIYHYH